MQQTDLWMKGMGKNQGKGRISNEEEEEETLTYQERRKIVSLNTAPDVFDSKLSRGINSDKSVFDRTAVFQTRE